MCFGGKGNIQEDANNLDQPNTSPYKKRSKNFSFFITAP